MSYVQDDEKDCSVEELRAKIQVVREIEKFALDGLFKDTGNAIEIKYAWAQEHFNIKQRRLVLEDLVQKIQE